MTPTAEPPDPEPPDPGDAPTRIDEADPGRRAGRRRLTAVCVGLLAAGATLESAARLSWFTGGVDAVGRGTVAVTATGADLVPALSATALLAVAGVAAAVALAGPLRRVLGGLVVAAGSWVAIAVVGLIVVPPTSADLAALPGAPTDATPVAGVPVQHAGPVVGVLGAALLIAAGIVLLTAERRLPRLGARYMSPVGTSTGRPSGPRDGAGPQAGRPDAAAARAVDPDRAAWDALDAGRDPTADDHPGVDHRAAGGTPADRSGIDHRRTGPPAVARPSTDAGRTDDSGSDRAV